MIDLKLGTMIVDRGGYGLIGIVISCYKKQHVGVRWFNKASGLHMINSLQTLTYSRATIGTMVRHGYWEIVK